MRHAIIRLISFLCLTTAWYFDVWWLAVPLLLWHCYQYVAYECVLLGICIDVQFMNRLGVPWYTLGAIGAVICAEVFKPMLRNRGNHFDI
jgi:hypothetical protein